MSIQRWDISGYEWEQDPHPEGDWVLFSDHEAAIRAAEQRVRAEQQTDLDHVSYVLGQTNERQRSVLLIADAYAAGVAAARDAVAALPHDTYCVTRDENYKRPCNCPVDDALAAIDALSE